jgi:hypothetical protein
MMKTEFWPNMEKARIDAKKERKAIILECGLTSNAFSRGLERKSDPGVSTAYRLAKAVDKTIEELVDGEKGAEYVRQWARNQGGLWEPPPRVAGVMAILNGLDDDELAVVVGAMRGVVQGLEDAKKGDRKATGTSTLVG